jgi:hypothetical protein
MFNMCKLFMIPFSDDMEKGAELRINEWLLAGKSPKEAPVIHHTTLAACSVSTGDAAMGIVGGYWLLTIFYSYAK